MAAVHSSTTTHQVRLLIDPGSEVSFISEALVSRLRTRREHSSLAIIGVGGGKATQTKGAVTLTLHSNYRPLSITLSAHVLKTVTTHLPSSHIDHQDWPHLKTLNLADHSFLRSRGIDIIVGADHYGQLIKPNIIKLSPDAPIAHLSIFGWLVLGPVTSACPSRRLAHHGITQQQGQNLDTLLTKFWLQEEPINSQKELLTQEEQECEDHFRDTHSRDHSGRYIVRIPLKSSPSTLGNSYIIAHKRLQHLTKRLNNDPDYSALYHQFMREYEELNHMVKVPASSLNSPVQYYLPHHGVLRLDKETTKLRVVFNGSAASSSGQSVNSLMHTGANLLLNIADVLIWIRSHRHLFTTDITKMYRQIKVHQDDWDLQRILWMDNQLKERHYHLTTVTYGTRSAPFLAIRTLLQLVEDEGHHFPLAVPSFIKGRYVDDVFGGADSPEDLIKVAKQVEQLCSRGCLPLAKWHSTHQGVLKEISPKEHYPSEISFDDCSTKVLGLKWTPHQDILTFSSVTPTQSHQSTKRQILSDVATIFDPLGFTSPVVIRAKMLLQELWLLKIGWDEHLPPHVISSWKIIRDDLTSLAKLSIPRWYHTLSNSTIDLHGFADASQLAMAAVMYLIVRSPSNSAQVSFVCAKTKVAPLKKLTIPRLELAAALLLSKLIAHVHATLSLNIKHTYLWTDSTVTLTWIKSHPSRWKTFVQNRVSPIQDLTQNAHWNHVPGADNPADCASRGVSTDQLKEHKLWWTGPQWLINKDQWPSQHIALDEAGAPEACAHTSHVAACKTHEYAWDLVHRYSSLTRLLRITALCIRIGSRLQKQLKTVPVITLNAADTENSRIFWVKATQSAFFKEELTALSKGTKLPSSHPFSRLTAFIDQQGIIRVGGRLNNSDLSYNSKHPAILPRNARLSELIIADSHSATMHGGTQLTLAHIRQLYWIIGGRAPVKSHALRCVVCARQRGIRAQQLMGQLPLARVQPCRAFTHTGIDYAGPLTLKTWTGRGAKTHKGWICVFVCLTTSSVHLEVVSDYSTDGFIATYRRFTSRRGIPTTVYSDCGTNFIGAETSLQKLFKQSTAENNQLIATLTKDHSTWQFNPPAAPHMGGKWEAVVKSIKFHLRRTISDTLLTFEETATLLTQIEALLNSRPLEPLSDDAEDLSALTPGHFLIGAALNAVPEPSLTELPATRLSRWQFIQQRAQQFWNQWSAHYLHRQQAISKWHHPNNSIKVGSLVLITDERLPPSKWPLARVTSTTPGADGLIRVVEVKTATTTLTRPLAKLSPLPVISSAEDITQNQQPGC